MKYELLILPRAQKELAKIPDPRPARSRKLSGRPGFRLRVGNYRVLYDVDDSRSKIIILHVGHRRDVYR